MYESILVATDGSDPGDRAVQYAIDLASTFDARLTAVSVVDTRRYGDTMLSDANAVVDDLSSRAEEILDDVRMQAAVDVETDLRRGRPHTEIASAAADRDVDLVVLGNRGLGSSGEIGSTAERVVRNVDRPVLTV